MVGASLLFMDHPLRFPLFGRSRASGTFVQAFLRISLLLLLGCCRGFAAPDAAPAAPEGAALPLEGLWKFTFDKQEQGEAQGFAAPEFDDAGWEERLVPGAYDHQGRGDLGIVWYRRSVLVPAHWKGRPVFLQLPPVDDSDTTYWNGTKIGGLNSRQFQRPRLYPVPEEAIRWGEKNVIAVRVVNKYMSGGFSSFTPARLLTTGPLAPFPPSGTPAPGDDELPLEATRNLAGKIGKQWVPGWRDAGTADTRPRMHARPGPEPGTEALGFEITHPNASGEFVDYNLSAREIGAIWQLRGYDYIAFDYQSDKTQGEMRLYLNRGGWKWQKGDAGFGASFPVRKGGWTHVVLPLAGFHKAQPRAITYLNGGNGTRALSLGYRNNEMDSAGEVKFANFRVGRFQEAGPQGVSLNGLWHLGRGEAAGKEAGFRSWPVVAPGFSWADQKVKDATGILWLKQEVFIPKEWKNMELRLRFGQVRSVRDVTEVYLNGAKLGSTGTHDPKLDLVVPPDAFKPGELNTVAIRVAVAKGPFQGIFEGPFELHPQTAWVAIRKGAEPAVIASQFDPGPLVGKGPYELLLRFPARLPGGQAVSYQVVDCFHRVIAEGKGEPRASADGAFSEIAVPLDDAAARRFYFSEYFDLHLVAENNGAHPLYAGTRLRVAMRYDQRDRYAREPLPEVWEETPYGRLKRIDLINAAEDPAVAGDVYKEGGHRESWVGRRAYSPWVQGITIGELDGKKYREANNNEWFGYRVGRGKIVPGKAYLVRMEYPEDKTRYSPINIDAGRNYQGLGFKTGVSGDDPFDNYPISGRFEFFDTVVIPDKLTYGSNGSRSTPVENGFWIFFHDTGRAYVPQYQAGPAVSRILVYELPEGAAAHAAIRYPDHAPRRVFAADWEREPEWVARDMVNHALICGYNAITPSILKWGSLAYWHVDDVEKLPLRPSHPVREPLAADQESALDQYLKATRGSGITLFPRLEYGGTDALPKAARAIGPNGAPAKPNRFHSWCSNLLRPEPLDEFTAILDQVIGRNIKENPQLGGILFRIRSDRLPISYGPDDVALYAKETGEELPAGLDGKGAAKWATDGARHARYIDWWQGKRRDFHAKMLERLRRYRPDLAILYYNWDPDRWNLGEYHRTPEDYRDYYNVHESIHYYERAAAFQKTIAPEAYAAMIREKGAPHHRLKPELYAGLDGFALLGPVNWHYLADNGPYINGFRTGERLALTKLFDYEERGRWNVQGDNYETSELMTAGPAYAMAEEVMTVFHGDPWVLTETAYTYGGGFIKEHRAFAQAFLALPAVPGQVVETPGLAGAEDLRVRRYAPKGSSTVYLGLAYKGYHAQNFPLELPGPWAAAVKVTDAVSGAEIPAEVREGRLVLEIACPPTSLQTFRVEPK